MYDLRVTEAGGKYFGEQRLPGASRALNGLSGVRTALASWGAVAEIEERSVQLERLEEVLQRAFAHRVARLVRSETCEPRVEAQQKQLECAQLLLLLLYLAAKAGRTGSKGMGWRGGVGALAELLRGQVELERREARTQVLGVLVQIVRHVQLQV